MAIEVTTKIEIKENRWAFFLFILCLIVFLAMAGSYAFLYITSDRISQDIQDKKDILAQTPPEKELEEELILYETKINTFNQLLSRHQKVLNIFSVLEQICHPQVLFSNFDFAAERGTVVVSGQAENFVVLGQQFFILEEAEFFKKTDISGIAMDQEGRVGFSLRFELEPEVFE